MSHSYDPKFMAYADRSSRHSARRVGSLLLAQLPLGSVLDVGCARGTWLEAWKELGVDAIAGVDGAYVKPAELVIPQADFRAFDLSQPLDLGRRFDLVQSLEVAEHIPATSAATFVDNLARHSHGLVLFSAAPPGQGGEFHVNEQPYQYWRELFAHLGFHAHDYLRPQLAADPEVSFWYRYNLFLYVHEDRLGSLPPAIAASRVAVDQPLADCSPPLFRLRKRLVRLLPAHMRDGLARFKANFLPSGRW